MSTKITKNTVTGELNFQLADIIGEYTPDKPESPYYTNSENGLTFKLCERKEPTPLKPQYYLMQRNANGWMYLTSLYPKTNGYTIEIKRKYYTVILQPDKGGFRVI